MGPIWKSLYFFYFMVPSFMCLAYGSKTVVESCNECRYVCIKEDSCLNNLPILIAAFSVSKIICKYKTQCKPITLNCATEYGKCSVIA